MMDLRALRAALESVDPGQPTGGQAAEEEECHMEVLLPHGSSMVAL